MTELSCDVAVIGAGTAGLAAREAAAAAGARVVLIEAGPGGTTCARIGCMPSKLLIAAASAMHAATGADRFGVRVPAGVRADGPAVMARVRRERDRFVAAIREGVAALPPECVLAGHARFTGPTALLVDDRTRVSAGAVVIATGARASVPEVLEPVRDRVLTNETVFELPDLPASVAVLGAGPIGIELGQALHRLGVRVAIVDPGERVGGLTDPEVAAAARAALSGELDLRLRHEVRRAARAGDGVRLAIAGPEGEVREETFERVIAAAGRPPNLDGLDLDWAGIARDARGTPLFDPRTRRCGEAPIYLAGDAAGDRPVLHEARRSGLMAGENAARHPDAVARAPWANLSVVYSRPELAMVGPPYDADGVARGAVRVGTTDFGDQGRAIVEGEAAGLLRVYVDPAGRLIGGQMACPGAEHLGPLLALAVQEGWDAARLLDRPFYHPTLEEGLQSALRALAG